MHSARRPAELAGHNRISTQALTSVAKVAAAEVLAVAPAQVRVSLALTTPVRWRCPFPPPWARPPLQEVRRNPARVAQSGGSILARATAAKARILDQVEYLSGSQAEPCGRPHLRSHLARDGRSRAVLINVIPWRGITAAPGRDPLAALGRVRGGRDPG